MVIEVLSELPKEFQLPLIKAFTALREELADSVRREDFNELKAVVQELVEAQKRTEERVEELTEAQKRTEQRVDALAVRMEELAEAQKRTEQRVDTLAVRMEELAVAQAKTEERMSRLELRMEELVEAQKRTEDQIKQLAAAQERTEITVGMLNASLEDTRKMVAGLSDSVGYGLEDRAIRNLAPLLEERYGFRVQGKLCRKFLPYMGGSEEVNIFGIAEREGTVVTLLGEAKAHLSVKHIDRFLRQIERLKSLGAVTGEVFPFMVSYSIRPEVESYAREKSVFLFRSYEV